MAVSLTPIEQSLASEHITLRWTSLGLTIGVGVAALGHVLDRVWFGFVKDGWGIGTMFGGITGGLIILTVMVIAVQGVLFDRQSQRFLTIVRERPNLIENYWVKEISNRRYGMETSLERSVEVFTSEGDTFRIPAGVFPGRGNILAKERSGELQAIPLDKKTRMILETLRKVSPQGRFGPPQN